MSQGIGLSLGLGLEGLVSFDITGTKCLKSDLAIRVQMMMPHSPIIGRPGKTVVYSKRFIRGQHRSGDPSPDDAGVSRRSGRVPVPAADRVSSCVIRSRPILPKMPLPWGIRPPWFLGPSRHLSLYPRPQVDRISRFVHVQLSVDSPSIFYIGPGYVSREKSAHSSGGSRPSPNTWFVGARAPQNGTSIGSAVFVERLTACPSRCPQCFPPPPKISMPLGTHAPRFPVPTRVHTPNGTSIGSSVSARRLSACPSRCPGE